ncbi:leucine--tRNA ligase [Hydrotalea sandarakina]|jgi:leucyl-tRNA synthetase|uniref:Leucine--tRNA ligase n=1 Tax=Hydrotalea sandarakina TaxID=1004304 RepID=A0A2W7RKX5_9BACT|nr:class I tRNA ligase family protein [Hydrotalea sandarakina]PZX61468.1 leucyl-tRNA synthetase [Hydrotalea sandarakina]
MEYNFKELEQKWQQYWNENRVYAVPNQSSKPKFYVLDMFPYPSGAGLHVGHPLGYIASDIFARYKRLKGFNVLHPMGYDAFGLPAEQYAIEHGIHPAISTENNIRNFRSQLNKIGFSFDWEREVKTCDPAYYKWTQWIFLELFNSFFDRNLQKARPIAELIAAFAKQGNQQHECPGDHHLHFTADEWNNFSESEQQNVLMQYRLAYCGYGEVNWCPALGTVLANDEVVNGVSERGGHPVEKKKLRQWYLRITEYADRLLQGLETVDFSEAMKEMQTNWIGKSSGAEIDFAIEGSTEKLRVYTTRPDTIFGVDFMVIAPELALVHSITTPEQKQAIDEYLAYVKSRSDRERQAEKRVSGCFTGAYAINPFNHQRIPIWVAEYVLAGYGTGAIMAVPCGDERDFKFAQHFNIPITNIIGAAFNGKEANPTKDAVLENSGFLNGMPMRKAMEVVINELEKLGIGKRKVNYKMRDAAFSRQRYWGEPFPIKWINGNAVPLSNKDLPVLLPNVKTYSPGPEGEGPLANIPEWVEQHLETNTMPGYAGSSWYFLRYMDPHNDAAFCDRAISDYWGQVDVYVGGTEHAVGHLLYSRMWTKALYDLGYIGFDEPFKKLVNQGMIQGSSRFVYRIGKIVYDLIYDEAAALEYASKNFINDNYTKEKLNYEVGLQFSELFQKINSNLFVSKGIIDNIANIGIEDIIINKLNSIIENELSQLNNFLSKIKPRINQIKSQLHFNALHVDVNMVDGVVLDLNAFKQWRNGEYANAAFILEDGKYICGVEVEKMSKSKFNTVNPDDLVAKYGADTFRMYEMFLGPVEQSKPWDTKGIEGVHRFIKKLWRLFFDETKGTLLVNDNEASPQQLKILHKTIKKIEEDTERFSFNTAVAAFMVCVNELSDLNTHNKAILEPLVVMLAPYAPHVAEELWHVLGNTTSVVEAHFPQWDAQYLVESEKAYPVSVNGKLRTTIAISLEASQAEVEQITLQNEIIQKWIEGKPIKKFIFVKGKMINVVV